MTLLAWARAWCSGKPFVVPLWNLILCNKSTDRCSALHTYQHLALVSIHTLASMHVCVYLSCVVLQVLLSGAQALPLYPELALLHSMEGNHGAALLMLALLPPRLVEGAISYCRCG